MFRPLPASWPSVESLNPGIPHQVERAASQPHSALAKDLPHLTGGKNQWKLDIAAQVHNFNAATCATGGYPVGCSICSSQHNFDVCTAEKHYKQVWNVLEQELGLDVTYEDAKRYSKFFQVHMMSDYTLAFNHLTGEVWLWRGRIANEAAIVQLQELGNPNAVPPPLPIANHAARELGQPPGPPPGGPPQPAPSYPQQAAAPPFEDDRCGQWAAAAAAPQSLFQACNQWRPDQPTYAQPAAQPAQPVMAPMQGMHPAHMTPHSAPSGPRPPATAPPDSFSTWSQPSVASRPTMPAAGCPPPQVQRAISPVSSASDQVQRHPSSSSSEIMWSREFDLGEDATVLSAGFSNVQVLEGMIREANASGWNVRLKVEMIKERMEPMPQAEPALEPMPSENWQHHTMPSALPTPAPAPVHMQRPTLPAPALPGQPSTIPAPPLLEVNRQNGTAGSYNPTASQPAHHAAVPSYVQVSPAHSPPHTGPSPQHVQPGMPQPPHPPAGAPHYPQVAPQHSPPAQVATQHQQPAMPVPVLNHAAAPQHLQPRPTAPVSMAPYAPAPQHPQSASPYAAPAPATRAFRIGDQVFALWGEEEHPGKVLSFLANGMIQVHWDGEDTQSECEPSGVRHRA